ncbi:hypothetical protein KBX08_31305 [Micromonospora sp. H61]|uniref:hypothetical protein n=1 Tax=Micromonospora sp. H61 TaxID=2824888 RepID=UPI001B374B60|nr:hypothetical protein [Micromonospora sp. H61]MBQ0994553.1 hypothetical protein [Micromonospora sp. H61]
MAVEVPEAAHVHRPVGHPRPERLPTGDRRLVDEFVDLPPARRRQPTTTSRLVAVSGVATPVYASKPERRCSTSRVVSEMVSTMLSPSGSAWSLVKPIAR